MAREASRLLRLSEFPVTRQPLDHASKKRAAPWLIHNVFSPLKLAIHSDKRYIGKTAKGFDFLGYRFQPGQKLRPAKPSIDRLITRERRLREQRVDRDRLQQSVWRWYRWLQGGLRGRVSTQTESKGGASPTSGSPCSSDFTSPVLRVAPTKRPPATLVRQQW